MKIKEILDNLIKKLSKYLQADLTYLIKGGFLLSSAEVINLALGFLLSIAFANLLPKEIFGTYQYALSLASLLAIITLPNMNMAIIQAVARSYDGSIMPTIKLRLKWALLGSLICIIVAGYYFFLDGNSTLSVVYLIIAFFLPLINSLDIYNAYLKGKKLFKKLTKYTILKNLINFLILIPVLFLTDNIYIILIAFFGSTALLNIIFLKNTFKNNVLNTHNDPKTMSYGKHLNIMGVISVISLHIDKIIIWFFLGPIEVAIYTFSKSLPEKIILFFEPIGSLSMPKFSRQEDGVLKKYIPKKVFQSFIIFIPITVLYIILCPYFFRLVFPQYLDSIIYSQIYSLIILFQGSRLMISYLFSKIKQKEIYIINIAIPTLKIVLMLVFIPFYKIYGVMLALVIAEFFNFILLLIFTKRNA